MLYANTCLEHGRAKTGFRKKHVKRRNVGQLNNKHAKAIVLFRKYERKGMTSVTNMGQRKLIVNHN